MKLYKYKSLSNLGHVLDILLNKRLHCAGLKDLNDPIEGDFIAKFLIGKKQLLTNRGSSTHGQILGEWELRNSRDADVCKLADEIKKKKICSLSKSKNSVRLWSHYANGHCGIAIEINIHDDTIVRSNDDANIFFSKNVFEVDYQGSLAQLIHGPASQILDREAKKALRTKLQFWSDEMEVRIIQEDEYYHFSQRIERVYCGYNVHEALLGQLRKLFPKIQFVTTTLIEQEPWIQFNE